MLNSIQRGTVSRQNYIVAAYGPRFYQPLPVRLHYSPPIPI
jgi:hypothetical protein